MIYIIKIKFHIDYQRYNYYNERNMNSKQYDVERDKYEFNK